MTEMCTLVCAECENEFSIKETDEPIWANIRNKAKDGLMPCYEQWIFCSDECKDKKVARRKRWYQILSHLIIKR